MREPRHVNPRMTIIFFARGLISLLTNNQNLHHPSIRVTDFVELREPSSLDHPRSQAQAKRGKLSRAPSITFARVTPNQVPRHGPPCLTRTSPWTDRSNWTLHVHHLINNCSRENHGWKSRTSIRCLCLGCASCSARSPKGSASSLA